MSGALEAMSLEEARYSRVAIWFHWTIAALILVNLLLGFLHEAWGEEAEATVFFWHKSIGLTVLTLSLGRLGWRMSHASPPFDPALRRWEAALARTVHALFYLLMIALPLSGWAVTSTNGNATSIFGLFSVPPLPISQSRDVHEFWEEAHEIVAWFMLALIALHVAGAAKHHLQGHHHLIRRMGPWLYRPGRDSVGR